MNSKILIFSDLHLHNWSYGASYLTGWNSRLIDQHNTIKKMLKYAKENNITEIVFCGDFFHTHGKIDAYVLSTGVDIYREIAWNDMNFHFIPGNHDYADVKGFVTSTSFMSSSFSSSFEFNMFPYTEDKSSLENFLSVHSGLVFIHQGVKGVSVGNDFVLPNEIFSPDMIPDHIEHVFTGHYHTHNHVSDKLTIVGAPMQHTWADESETRGFLTYDLNSKEIEFHSLPGARFKTITSEEDFKALGENDKFLRVKNFEGDKEQFRKECLEKGVMSVEFVGNDSDIVDNSFKFTAPNDLRIQPIIEQYETIHNFSEYEKEIGAAIRNRTYNF